MTRSKQKSLSTISPSLTPEDFYRAILGVVEPWKIVGIKTDETKKEVHVELRYPEKKLGVCPTLRHREQNSRSFARTRQETSR